MKAAASDLGFRPNSQARALRSSRTGSIGLLIPDIRNPHFADLAHAVESRAREHGLVTLISSADERLGSQETSLRLLASHNVDGLIVVPQGQRESTKGSEVLESVVATGKPVVLVDRLVDGIDAPAIVPDTCGLTEAVRELLAQGHRRIALISGPVSSSTGRERLSAFTSALKNEGLTTDPELVVEGDFQPESGHEALKKLVNLPVPRRPSAVVIADGPMAVGAMAAVRELGVCVPGDLSVVAHDDLDAFRLCDPPLTAVAQDVAAMGEAAVRLLHEDFSEMRGKVLRQPTRLVRRASVGPPCRSGEDPACFAGVRADSNSGDLQAEVQEWQSTATNNDHERRG